MGCLGVFEVRLDGMIQSTVVEYHTACLDTFSQHDMCER